MVDGRHEETQLENREAVFYGRVAPRSPGEAIKPTVVPPPPLKTLRVRRHKGGFLSFISALLTLLLIGAVALCSAIYFGRQEFYAQGPLREARIVTVKGGSQVVAEALQREGIITHSLIFVAGLRLLGANHSIKAGEYAFPAGASMKDIMDMLVAGKSVQYPITLPEGLTTDQIIARLLANDLLVGEIDSTPPEGTLLPETYYVTRGTMRQAIVDRMVIEHRKVVDEIWKARAPNLPLKSPDELVILASIIEKETAVDEERARVASVFVNRLRKGMKLQSDPTIVYGIVGGKGTLGRGIRKSEVNEATPYNTYVIHGLPAGPIANPGRASLVAAANPAKRDDLYFVADGTGGHRFAKTLDEHNRNVAAWRKSELSRKANVGNDGGIDRVDPNPSSEGEDPEQAVLKKHRDKTDEAEKNAQRIKIIDSSEGTELDPLKNKTYDLTSPKDVL